MTKFNLAAGNGIRVGEQQPKLMTREQVMESIKSMNSNGHVVLGTDTKFKFRLLDYSPDARSIRVSQYAALPGFVHEFTKWLKRIHPDAVKIFTSKDELGFEHVYGCLKMNVSRDLVEITLQEITV